MKPHDYIFYPDEIALIKAAETMGNLPDILNEIANELENLQQIKQKIKKALTYPIILITLSVAAVVVLLIFVIPTIVEMFPNQESLPAVTQLMLTTS
jgi:type II secretory pathway component PulF